MGNSASGDEGRYRHGYHVLRVKNGSPAHQAGLRPYFDYIMAVNDIRLNSESTLLREQMEASVDKPMILDVYSTREQALRRIEMVPRRNWSGVDEDGLLGCSIRFTLFDTVIDVVWHVLDITAGSPAEQAGLCAHADYVIGTPLGIMRGEGDLYDLIEDYIGDPLPLHVYNVDRNQVREVVIVPSEEWGGEGLLGCDVGYGYLHRLPRQSSPLLEGQKDLSKEDTPLIAGEHVSSQESIDPGFAGLDGVNVSNTAVDGSKNADSAASEVVSEKERIQHSNTQPAGSIDPATPPSIDAQENPQQPGHEPSPANGDPCAPIPTQETHSTPAAATQPTLYPQASSLPLYPNVTAQALPLNGSTLTHEDVGTSDLSSPETTPEREASDESSSNTPLASQESTLHTQEPLGGDSEQQQQQQQQQQQRQPPPALASRMMPGIHGRGGRKGHDGYSARDKIPLQAAQAQAQEQSAEYRAQMERDLKDERDQTTEGEVVTQEQRSPVVQDHSGMAKEKDKDGDKVVEDNMNSMMEQQEADLAVHEFVVEGMIRNMALGSTVFPL
ncbi:Golgi reassembly-stacking protein 2 [Mortierella alpina]|nr:Golgi reassembly-stacking protein 2 [Mortierella alpina]